MKQSYDMLSDLGHQQARWLGAHLQDTRKRFYPRVYCGTLKRHVETAASMGLTQPDSAIARLNESRVFHHGAKLYEQQHGVAIPVDREGFVGAPAPYL